MTREQFNEAVEKEYKELLKTAKNMEEEPDQGEELLQDTLLDILEHEKFTGILGDSILFYVSAYMKGIRANRHKQENRRRQHEFSNGLEDPDSDEPLVDFPVNDPYPALDAKILTQEIYDQVGPVTQAYIDGLKMGYTALEAYHFSGLDITYSYFLRQVKADLERVLS